MVHSFENEAKYRVIGIAIVVDELHKGQRLVCRYPESVPSAVLNSTEELLKFHEEYLSLSPDNFAKLFRPKASLFNKILELTIDDLHYISFPCPCSDELSTDTSIQTATDVISLFNVIVVTVRESAMKKLEAIPGSNSKRNNQKRKIYSQHEKTGMDPVAVALGLQSHTQAVRPKVLRRIVETISCALLNQEKRNRYVSKQVALMLKLQEETIHSQLQYTLQQQITTSNGNYNNVMNDNAKKNVIAISGNTTNDNISGGKKKASVPSSLHLDGSSHVNPSQISKNNIDISNDSISNLVAILSNGNISSTGTASALPQRTSFIVPSSPITESTLPTTRSISPSITVDREIIPNGHSVSLNVNTSVATISPDKNLQVMESMQQQSSLANELRQIYHGLVGGHSVNLMVNGVISINIRLNEEINELKSHIKESKKKENETVPSPSIPLESWTESGHLSMLTIADKEEMLDIINCINSSSNLSSSSFSHKPSDINRKSKIIENPSKVDPTHLNFGLRGLSNVSGNNDGVGFYNCPNLHPDLQELVLSLDPTVSLDELSVQLEQPLVEIFTMCDHLLSWGLGRFVSTVTSERRYKVTSTAPVAATSLAAKSFASKFYELLNAAVEYLELELKTLIEEEEREHQETLRKQVEEKNLQESIRRKEKLNGVINSSGSLMITNSRPFSSHLSSSNVPILQSKGNSMFNFSHLNNPAARKNSDLSRNYNNYDRENVKTVKKGGPTIDPDATKDDATQKEYQNEPTTEFTSKYSKQRIDYTLPCILAVFNGFQTLDKAIRKLPLPLHPFGVDIVIWLLRWKMLEEVHIYVILLPDDNQEILQDNQAALEPDNSKNMQEASLTPPSPSSSSSHHHIEMPTVAELSLNSLNETELVIYHKIYPYLNGVLPLQEIAGREVLLEDDILRLVKKLPHINVFFS